MEIITVDTRSKQDCQVYMDLPFKLYKDSPYWVPPLAMDARAVLDRKQYPYYQHSDAQFFLALEQGETIGRIAVLENTRYNDFNHERTAFFYQFECFNNEQAALALFETAFEWARCRGLNNIIGPKGFTPLDGMGLLVQGFEQLPALGIPYNHDYYPALVEAAGFIKRNDVDSGVISGNFTIPETIHKVAERIKQRRDLHVMEFRKRSDLRKLVSRLGELYNGALEGTEGNYPPTQAEIDGMAQQILWFADPKLIKIVMKGDDPVGFLLAYPDISEALQQTKGRLFPFGWWSILRSLRNTRVININGAGLLPEHRGMGGMAILYSEMEKSIRQGDYDDAELVQVGQENQKMQRELTRLGVTMNKVHRVYQRDL